MYVFFLNEKLAVFLIIYLLLPPNLFLVWWDYPASLNFFWQLLFYQWRHVSSVHLSAGDMLLGLRHGTHLEALRSSSTWAHDGRQGYWACFHLSHSVKLLLQECGPKMLLERWKWLHDCTVTGRGPLLLWAHINTFCLSGILEWNKAFLRVVYLI